MRHLALFLLFVCSPALADQKLCFDSDIVVVDGRIELEENEKILICGTGKSERAWRSVPLTQAKYHLNVILQSEGFLDARFLTDGDSIKVYRGPVTKTKSLILNGSNGIVISNQKRKIVDEPMTSKKLDEVKDWAELEARRQGHACPSVQMWAEKWNQTIFANIEPGPAQTIGVIDRKGYGTLAPEALRRFEAFRVGGTYDVVETQITIDRMMAQGLFQNGYITTFCHGEKVDFDFFMEVGKPRLLRFGLGASTEEYPFVDIWFKNSRLDNNASSVLAQLHASNLRQSFELASEFYILPGSYNTFVGPRVKLERRNERSFESYKFEIGTDIGRAWDVSHIRLNGRIGPTINYMRTVFGAAPDEAKYLSWEARLAFMSHSYEAFSRSQSEGWVGDVNFVTQRKDIGATINVDRLELKFKHLYNLKGYLPPLIVLAGRLEAIFLNTDGRDEITDVPVDMRIFYGGSDNVRGFFRQALDNEGRGFLASTAFGTEMRIVQVVPFGLEPFILFDLAKLGSRQSPFGTLRFVAAKGEILNGSPATLNYPQEWNYGFSFGQEF